MVLRETDGFYGERNRVLREEQGVYKGLVVVHAFVKKKNTEHKDQKKNKTKITGCGQEWVHKRDVNSMKSPMEYLERKKVTVL